MENNIQEMLGKLKALGVDIAASEYALIPISDEAQLQVQEMKDIENSARIYITDVKAFVNSMDFMRLGQSINHKQWQAAAMKAAKMSAEAKRLGMTRFERPFTGIRQNINRRNSQEALQALSMIITMRVKIIELLGIK